MVICLERGADLHMAQLMPLSLTVSCFSKIRICFTFLVPAHPGSPGKRAVKRMCVCDVFLCFYRFWANKDLYVIAEWLVCWTLRRSRAWVQIAAATPPGNSLRCVCQRRRRQLWSPEAPAKLVCRGRMSLDASRASSDWRSELAACVI